MTPATLLRLTALAGVLLGVAWALLAPAPDAACSTALGACRQPAAPPCGLRLGDWRVARSRSSGLPADRSHSACILAATAAPAGASDERRDHVVSVLPQPAAVSGDTLVSLVPAARRDAQRAAVRLDVIGSLPDHWAFAVAGAFLDVDTPHGCDDLTIRLPVNAGYALIGGNWQDRPHGFYFERLADACVYDGTRPACAGEFGFVAHEFAAGESFALDLALRAEGAGFWLDAEIAALAPAGGSASAPQHRLLGRMRQRVAAPCWLAPGAPGHAVLVVIPDPDPATHTPATRVDVSRFAWLEPGPMP